MLDFKYTMAREGGRSTRRAAQGYRALGMGVRRTRLVRSGQGADYVPYFCSPARRPLQTPRV